MRNYREQILQQHFAHWLDAKRILFTASMVGVFLPVKYAVLRKRMGVKKGSPDIMIFEPSKRYKGLFIELKSPTGNVKDIDQIYWQEELNKRGYLAVIMPKGMEFQEALIWLKKCVNEYLSADKGYEEDKNRDLRDYHPQHPDDR